jgi:sugar lactone lactonase YvrE
MSAFSAAASDSAAASSVTLFSSGPAATNGFNCPMGMACDSKNDLFVCDGGNNQIVKVDTNGQASVVQLYMQQANSKGKVTDVSANPLSFPEMLVFDHKGGRYNGYMYIMDGNNTIYKVKCNSGVYTSYATIVGHYIGLAMDTQHNLYYCSYDYPSETAKTVTQRIYKVAPATGGAEGVSSLFIDLSGVMVYPGGLAASNKYLYVADMGGNTVGKYDLATGAVVDPSFITFSPPNNSSFDPTLSVPDNYTNNPTFTPYAGNQCNLAVAPNGDLIVVAGNDRKGNNTSVYRYDKHGKLVETLIDSSIKGPLGVTVASDGKIYVGNQMDNTVYVIA